IMPDKSDMHYLVASKWLTAMWGVIALGFALTADLFENLIEAVNILGSIFYGTILGIFLVAFFFKFVKGWSVFIAALIAQTLVILTFVFFSEHISYLYFNVIGCGLVIGFAVILSMFQTKVAE